MSTYFYSRRLVAFRMALLWFALVLYANWCSGGIRKASDSSRAWCTECGHELRGRWNGRYVEWEQPCPYCPQGTGSSYNAMPVPKTWNDVRNNVGQSLGNSFMQGFQQGVQNNQAAQQEAARRAAEAAAAAERRRQELLQKAAEEARMNWEQQDAANLAAFGNILSSKKTGGGMSSLLMKQAQQSSGAGSDSSVVDLSDTANRIPQIPGVGAAATPFGDALISAGQLGSDTNLVVQTEQFPGAWNDSGVVDLRDMTNRIPQIPGMGEVLPFDNQLMGGPIHESSLHPLSGMSDEQLEKKEAALKKAVADIHKLIDQNTKEYETLALDAQAGMDAAWQTLSDVGTTLAFGGLQGLTEPKAESALFKSINLPGGTAAKKEAMREAVQAAKDVRAVETGAQGVETIQLASTLAFTDDTGDKLAATATAAGGLMVRSPLGAVPGVVKTGLDTGWVWSDYLMLKQQYDRREKLGKQYNDALIHLSSEQAAVIAEQNRRKAVSAMKP